jgi:hypothetical protein
LTAEEGFTIQPINTLAFPKNTTAMCMNNLRIKTQKYQQRSLRTYSTFSKKASESVVRYAARTGQNGHEHSVSARLDAVFIEL